MGRPTYYALLAAILMSLFAQHGTCQGHGVDHWVASWATAQEMAPTEMDRPVLPPSVQRPNFQGPRPQAPTVPASIENETIRMIVHMGVGGSKVRIELSNAFGKKPLLIGEAHVGVSQSGPSIVAGSDRKVTFSGRDAAEIEPGAVLVSDPIDLSVQAQADLAVSLFVKTSNGAVTTHTLGLHTNYIADGNAASIADLKSKTTTLAYLWLSAVDVIAPGDAFAIVALGDSITDGFKTTPNTNHAWPTLLQRRLLEAHSNASVLNEGISGNEVLRDGAGVAALARFDRDVLAHPGVKWLILLEGINDINIHGQIKGNGALTSADLIGGYKQIIERAHLYKIRVLGATLTPEEGVWLAGPIGEATRNQVNQWIRTSGAFDAVVDFDRVVRDPQHPSRLKGDLNPGDNIHPNDAGNQMMADAFVLSEFTGKDK